MGLQSRSHSALQLLRQGVLRRGVNHAGLHRGAVWRPEDEVNALACRKASSIKPHRRRRNCQKKTIKLQQMLRQQRKAQQKLFMLDSQHTILRTARSRLHADTQQKFQRNQYDKRIKAIKVLLERREARGERNPCRTPHSLLLVCVLLAALT